MILSLGTPNGEDYRGYMCTVLEETYIIVRQDGSFTTLMASDYLHCLHNMGMVCDALMKWYARTGTNCLAALFFNKEDKVARNCDQRVFNGQVEPYAAYMGNGTYVVGYQEAPSVSCLGQARPLPPN